MAYRIQKEKQLTQAAQKALQQSVDSELFQFAEYDPNRAEQTGYSNYSYWKSTFAVFRRNKVAMGLLILIAVILLFTFIQPYLPGQRPATLINNDPVTGMHMANRKPDAEFWFGTNSIGQDLWSMLRMALAIPAAIGNEVFITYIGLGLPVDTPSLGNLINTGRTVMTTHGSSPIYPASVRPL